MFLFGGWLSRHYELSISLESTSSSDMAEGRYEPHYRQVDGPQLVLLFVGSSTCLWSNDSRLPEALETLKVQLSEHARKHGLQFRAIGVSVDWRSDDGVQYLAGLGAFDEISIGSNWTNSTLLDYVWERGGIVATPAVFVYRHELLMQGDSAGIQQMRRDAGELMLFRTGLPEILALTELGPDRYLSDVVPMGQTKPAIEERHGS
jgi:hypothetical protein